MSSCKFVFEKMTESPCKKIKLGAVERMRKYRAENKDRSQVKRSKLLASGTPVAEKMRKDAAERKRLQRWRAKEKEKEEQRAKVLVEEEQRAMERAKSEPISLTTFLFINRKKQMRSRTVLED